MTKRGRRRRRFETKTERVQREADELERKTAALKRSLISRGELREALVAVEERFVAWWSGGDAEQKRVVVAATLGIPIDDLPSVLIEDPASIARRLLRKVRTDMLSTFAPDTSDYPIPRRPEKVTEMTGLLWSAVLRGLGGEDPPAA